MYGMVNQAIKEMVCEVFDSNTWEVISTKASIPSDDFQIFQQYDDEVTLNLVVAICEISKKEAPEILESFGEYWIRYAFKSDYKDLLNTFANSPTELISSLNTLHDRLEMSFNELNPPAFDIVAEEEKAITINYYSDRDMPLQFFVKGLFQGIFIHFGQKCDVEILDQPLGDAKASFVIKYV